MVLKSSLGLVIPRQQELLRVWELPLDLLEVLGEQLPAVRLELLEILAVA